MNALEWAVLTRRRRRDRTDCLVLLRRTGEVLPVPAANGAGGIQRADLTITGMTCAACVSRVEKAARRVPGVTDAAVNLLANRGTFSYDPAQTSPSAIAAAIEKIGYEAAPLTPADAEAGP